MQPVTTTITISEDDVRRSARSTNRYLLAKPGLIVVTVVGVIVIAGAIALRAMGGDGGASDIAVIFLGLLLVVLWIVLLIGARRTHQSALAMMPVGSEATSVVSDDGLRFTTPVVDQTTGWQAYTKAVVRDDAVIVRLAGSRLMGFFPRRAFSDEALEIIRAHVKS